MNFSLLFIFTRFNLFSYILSISRIISFFVSSMITCSSLFCSSGKKISNPFFFSLLFLLFFLLSFLWASSVSCCTSEDIFDIQSFVLIIALFSSFVKRLKLSFSSLKGMFERRNFKSSFESILTESELLSFSIILFSTFFDELNVSYFTKLFCWGPPNLSIISFKDDSIPPSILYAPDSSGILIFDSTN